MSAADKKKLDGIDTSIIGSVYPVGSVYISTVSTGPDQLFGGTWQRLKDRFLLAAGDTYAPGSMGGETAHKLTAAESGLPSHSHGFTQPTFQGEASRHTHRLWTSTKRESDCAGLLNSGAKNGIGGPHGGSDTDLVYSRYDWNGNAVMSSTEITPKGSITGGAVQDSAAAGAAQAHNNMPPYLAVYMWVRTS